MLGIQEWLDFFFELPKTAAMVYREHARFIQSLKLTNTAWHITGEGFITHPGLEYYD